MKAPSDSTQLLLVGVLLAIVAWFTAYLFLGNLNPVWLLLTLGAYSVGLLMVHRPWRRAKLAETEELPNNNESNAAEQAEDALRRLELVIDGTSDGVWDWDMRKDRDRIFWSDRAHLLLRMTRDELGDHFDVFKSMMHPDDRDEFNKSLRKHILYKTPFHLEVRIRKTAGKNWRYFLIRGKVKCDDANQPVRMAGSISDVTERKTAQEELSFNVYHDALTLLPNRSWFLEMLAKTARLSLGRTDDVFAVLLVNIDRFKQINDNLGPLAGDAILIETTRRFRTIFPDEEMMARMGADDFAFILRDIRQAGDATRLASHIRSEFSRPFVIEGHDLYLSVSIGIVFSGEEDHSSEMLLQDANTVLNQAKAKGGNSVEVFTKGMRERENHRYQMARDLRSALDQQQFYISYQPLVNLADETLGGFEALLRWRHPDNGEIPPDQFIPVAEESGEILKIGEWVLRTACAQAKKWVALGHPNLVISVNVSAPQFTNQDIAEVIGRSLRESGLEARHLKVELTESVAMTDLKKTVASLQRLQQMGVAVAIDDFGTGYSSLSYLQRYPISALKIDQSFVRDLAHADGIAIVSMIISMARTLDLSIVAEGVETIEQRDFLKKNGVHQAQGFLYSRPLPFAEVEEVLLSRWQPATALDGVSHSFSEKPLEENLEQNL